MSQPEQLRQPVMTIRSFDSRTGDVNGTVEESTAEQVLAGDQLEGGLRRTSVGQGLPRRVDGVPAQPRDDR